MKLNRRIKAERIARGVSQEEMAEYLHISLRSYINREHGKTDFKAAELLGCAERLEIPLENIHIFFR